MRTNRKRHGDGETAGFQPDGGIVVAVFRLQSLVALSPLDALAVVPAFVGRDSRNKRGGAVLEHPPSASHNLVICNRLKPRQPFSRPCSLKPLNNLPFPCQVTHFLQRFAGGTSSFGKFRQSAKQRCSFAQHVSPTLIHLPPGVTRYLPRCGKHGGCHTEDRPEHPWGKQSGSGQFHKICGIVEPGTLHFEECTSDVQVTFHVLVQRIQQLRILADETGFGLRISPVLPALAEQKDVRSGAVDGFPASLPACEIALHPLVFVRRQHFLVHRLVGKRGWRILGMDFFNRRHRPLQVRDLGFIERFQGIGNRFCAFDYLLLFHSRHL